MSSTVRQYAQRDNRVETVTLTGNIIGNGAAVSFPTDVERPAYGAIDLTRAKNFYVDASKLVLRTDIASAAYVVRLYLSSTQPPAYYPNLEFNIQILPPPKGVSNKFVFVYIYTTQSDAFKLMADTVNLNTGLYTIANIYSATPPIGISQTVQTATFQVVNNTIVLKTISPGMVVTEGL